MFMCWLCGIARIVENAFFADAERACVVVERSSRENKLSNSCNDEY
jgi:hypothetical protein